MRLFIGGPGFGKLDKQAIQFKRSLLRAQIEMERTP
jgi:hypothetical protein